MMMDKIIKYLKHYRFRLLKKKESEDIVIELASERINKTKITGPSAFNEYIGYTNETGKGIKHLYTFEQDEFDSNMLLDFIVDDENIYMSLYTTLDRGDSLFYINKELISSIYDFDYILIDKFLKDSQLTSNFRSQKDVNALNKILEYANLDCTSTHLSDLDEKINYIMSGLGFNKYLEFIKRTNRNEDSYVKPIVSSTKYDIETIHCIFHNNNRCVYFKIEIDNTVTVIIYGIIYHYERNCKIDDLSDILKGLYSYSYTNAAVVYYENYSEYRYQLKNLYYVDMIRIGGVSHNIRLNLNEYFKECDEEGNGIILDDEHDNALFENNIIDFLKRNFNYFIYYDKMPFQLVEFLKSNYIKYKKICFIYIINELMLDTSLSNIDDKYFTQLCNYSDALVVKYIQKNKDEKYDMMFRFRPFPEISFKYPASPSSWFGTKIKMEEDLLRIENSKLPSIYTYDIFRNIDNKLYINGSREPMQLYNFNGVPLNKVDGMLISDISKNSDTPPVDLNEIMSNHGDGTIKSIVKAIKYLKMVSDEISIAVPDEKAIQKNLEDKRLYDSSYCENKLISMHEDIIKAGETPPYKDTDMKWRLSPKLSKVKDLDFSIIPEPFVASINYFRCAESDEILKSMRDTISMCTCVPSELLENANMENTKTLCKDIKTTCQNIIKEINVRDLKTEEKEFDIDDYRMLVSIAVQLVKDAYPTCNNINVVEEDGISYILNGKLKTNELCYIDSINLTIGNTQYYDIISDNYSIAGVIEVLLKKSKEGFHVYEFLSKKNILVDYMSVNTCNHKIFDNNMSKKDIVKYANLKKEKFNIRIEQHNDLVEWLLSYEFIKNNFLDEVTGNHYAGYELYNIKVHLNIVEGIAILYDYENSVRDEVQYSNAKTAIDFYITNYFKIISDKIKKDIIDR